MRNFVSAVRAVKLYPVNQSGVLPVHQEGLRFPRPFSGNSPPVFARCAEDLFPLRTDADGKGCPAERAIAQDLFGKGIREILFREGVTEEELSGFCAALALSPEDQALKSGIVSILWEQGVTNIKVTEAALEEVITAQQEAHAREASRTLRH